MKKIIFAAALAVSPMIAFADAAEDAIEGRQGFFTMLSINMGTLSGMARGQIDYDEAAAVRAAANIEALTGYDLPSLFIEGTSNADTDDTAALPAIWQNSEDFATKFAGLRDAAAGASEAVAGGQANVGPVVQQLGGACKACHDNYRQPE